jgi:tetratricopeptide (TPR) repeat protein
MANQPMSDDEAARLHRSTRQRVAAQSFGLALLMAGIATLSILIFRGQFHSFHLFRAHGRAAGAGSAHAPSLAHDQVLVKVAPEPAASVEPPKNQPAPERHLSPTEMFARAVQARENGDLSGAIAISEQIEQFFPSSPEGITTHLSLGVIYMQQGKPNLALGEFEIYRHIGNPDLMAEALWGQAQALKLLARPSDEREILMELLKSYPRSVYVAAAKERLNALPAAEH